MRTNALAQLVSPYGHRPLKVVSFAESGEHVIEGMLDDGSRWFPIIRGLPVFPSETLQVDLSAFCARHGLPQPTPVTSGDDGQVRTNTTFSDKWRRFKNYGLEETHKEFLDRWYA